jgi:hypothetical protein
MDQHQWYRAVMHQFEGEPGTRKSTSRSRKLWTAFHALDIYLTDQSEWRQLRRASPSRIDSWHRDHRKDGQFAGESSDEQIAADAMVTRRGRSTASGSVRFL